MAIELTAEESGSPIPLEAGTYAVTVAKVEEVESKNPEWPDNRVLLYLETVDEVDEDGVPIEIWAYATKKLTTKSKLYRWVTAIIGQPPELGKTFLIEELLTGKPCRVQLEEVTKDGETRKRVSAILAPSKRQPPAANGAKPKDELAEFCSECADPVSYFDKVGDDFKGFCDAHGPRGSGR